MRQAYIAWIPSDAFALFLYSAYTYARMADVWRNFFSISFVLGLTKAGFGCRLYDIGSIWSRCSPQSIQVDDEILTGAFGCRSEEKSKNLRESV